MNAFKTSIRWILILRNLVKTLYPLSLALTPGTVGILSPAASPRTAASLAVTHGGKSLLVKSTVQSLRVS